MSENTQGDEAHDGTHEASDPRPLFWTFDGGSYLPTSWKGWAILVIGLVVVIAGGNWLGHVLGMGR